MPDQFGTILVTLINCIGMAFLVRFFCEKLSVLRWIVISLCATVCGYFLSSVPLFWADCFSVFRTVLLETVGIIIIAISRIVFLRRKKIPVKQAQLIWNFKEHFIPLFLAIIAIAISWNNFGFFGMGQDQGVYQTKAIDLMYGKTKRIYHLEEYNRLGSESEKEVYINWTNEYLAGLYMMNINGNTHELLPAFINPDNNRDLQTNDGVYHGSPTYPALLAWWGVLFGLENMSGIQTLFYVLTILVLWLTAENLGLKKITAFLASSIYLISPIALWISKSTLTEGYLALTIALFLFFLTLRPNRKWWSAWMASVFSCLHVSIFVMFPMFITLYTLMGIRTKQKQYFNASLIAGLSFIIGFTFIVYMSPAYAIANTQVIWNSFIKYDNVYYILLSVGFVSTGISLLLQKYISRVKFNQFIKSKTFSWLIRILIMILFGLAIWNIITRSAETGEYFANACKSGINNMIWMSGIVVLPGVIGIILFKPTVLTENDENLSLLFVFLYAVLLFSCVLKNQVKYNYYYGRYLTPYIPVICITAGIIWNRFSEKRIGAGMLASVLMMIPFDQVVVTQKDDTWAEYGSITRITEKIERGNTAVIYDLNTAPRFFLPVRAITGNDSYFAFSDTDSLISELDDKYDHLYMITTQDTKGTEILKMADEVFLDENYAYRFPWCVFPYAFPDPVSLEYTIYEVGSPKY